MHGQLDQVVLASDMFYVFAGLGPIQDGYLIITPRRCDDPSRPLQSLSDFSAIHSDQLMFLRGIVGQFYRDHFQEPGMSFEHGRAGTCLSRSGGTKHCYHSHLCCYPRSVDLLDAGELAAHPRIEVERYAGIAEVGSGSPYLFVENCVIDDRYPADHVDHEKWSSTVLPISDPDRLESQLLRKLLARRCGVPELWDWRQYPRVEMARSLVQRFRSWLREPAQKRYSVDWITAIPRLDYVSSVVRCNQMGNDYVAARYQEKWGNRIQHGALGRFLRHFPDNQSRPLRILDLGCGPGNYTRALHAAGMKVVGTDVSSEMLSFAQKSIPQSASSHSISSVAWIQGNVLEACFCEESFHGIWFSAVWVHVPRVAARDLVGRLSRMLIPGGTLYVSAQIGTGSIVRLEGRTFFFYTDSEMQELFREARLDLFETWTGEVSDGTCGDTRVKYWRHYILKRPVDKPNIAVDDRRLASLGEEKILQHIRQWTEAASPSPSLIMGIGDDCAVVKIQPGMVAVTTVDHCPSPVISSLAGDDPWYKGWFSMLISLSDLAAMGARPVGMLLAVESSRDTPLRDLARFYEGVMQASREFTCPIIGGNLREGAAISCVSTALGEVAPDKLLTRGAARTGEDVVVIGDMGLFLAGVIARVYALNVKLEDRQELDRNLKAPRPRLNEGRAIADRGLSRCAMDSSDGLIASFQQLAAASGLDIHIDLGRTVVHPAVQSIAAHAEFDIAKLLLGWGDWQIVCTCDPGRFAELAEAMSVLNCPVHKVGWTARGNGSVWLHEASGTSALIGLPNERFTNGSYFAHDIASYLSLLRSTPLTGVSSRREASR